MSENACMLWTMITADTDSIWLVVTASWSQAAERKVTQLTDSKTDSTSFYSSSNNVTSQTENSSARRGCVICWWKDVLKSGTFWMTETVGWVSLIRSFSYSAAHSHEVFETLCRQKEQWPHSRRRRRRSSLVTEEAFRLLFQSRFDSDSRCPDSVQLQIQFGVWRFSSCTWFSGCKLRRRPSSVHKINVYIHNLISCFWRYFVKIWRQHGQMEAFDFQLRKIKNKTKKGNFFLKLSNDKSIVFRPWCGIAPNYREITVPLSVKQKNWLCVTETCMKQRKCNSLLRVWIKNISVPSPLNETDDWKMQLNASCMDKLLIVTLVSQNTFQPKIAHFSS